MLFNDTVQRSAPSLIERSNLITKTVFPSEILPMYADSLSAVVSHLLAVASDGGGGGVSGSPGQSLHGALLPYICAHRAVLSWLVSSLHVFLGISHRLSPCLTFWFWLTPILISEDQVLGSGRPSLEKLRFLVIANPMFYAVRASSRCSVARCAPTLGDTAVLAVGSAGVYAGRVLLPEYMKRGSDIALAASLYKGGLLSGGQVGLGVAQDFCRMAWR